MDALKVTRKQVEPIIKATFPTYRGRKISVCFTDKVTFSDTNWGDGSRNFYAALRSDGRNARLHVPAPWVNPIEGMTIDLPADVLIIEHSIFCGQDCGIRIYAHPVNAPKWLTA